MTAPVPTVSTELKGVLRQVKLGRCLDTLPERLALAKSRNMGHAEFLELVLSDEVTRRETTSAALRARSAGLDPDMCLEHWDEATEATFDRQIWDELCSLRFIDAGHNVMIMGPVGVGKTFMASVLGHVAVRRRYTVTFCRTAVLLKRLRASRLDNSHDTEMRKLMRVDLLVLDDFALQPFDALDTADIYELVVERHRSRIHPRHLQPRTRGVDRPDDRRLARPVRHRSPAVGRLRADSRRRVLSAPPKAGPRRRWDHTSSASSTSTLLTDATPNRHHRLADAGIPREVVPSH